MPPAQDAPTQLPYLTPGRAGCGGAIKRRFEDFIVEELPAYDPCGTGEHLFVRIEKRGLSTPQALERFRRAFGLPPAALGYARLKDAQAVSRQWISLHSHADLPLHQVDAPDLRVLAVSRHGNKLRRGHLRGNRFELLVRGATPFTVGADPLGVLAARGFPNYYGPQRYGHDGRNALRGRELLLGKAATPRGHSDRQRFLVNAYQSALFDELVARRLGAVGDLHTLLAGDLPVLHANGASFHLSAPNLAATQPRADEGELSPSAPLFGYRIELAAGTPGEWERDLLTREGLCLEDFRLRSKGESPGGERRAVRALPADLTWEWLALADGPALRLRFTLAPGVYATSLLREVMKRDADAAEEAPPAVAEAEHG